MKLWGTQPGSLAMRLGLYFSLGLALVVALGGVTVYWTFSAAIERELREDLTDKVQQLRHSVDDFLLRPQDIKRKFFNTTEDDSGARLFMRIKDANGRILFESAEMQQLNNAPFPSPAPGLNSRIQVRRWVQENDRRFRLVAVTIVGPKGPDETYVAELALDATRVKRLLHRTRNGLWIGGVIGMLLAFFMGRALVSRGLSPLEEIGRAAISMSPEQLRMRLVAQGWSREISELAKAFNAMLEKLDDSFERLSNHSAVLSHELRTPLHHLRLRSDVVLSKKRSAAAYRRALEANLEEIGRLSQTVDSVLFIARSSDLHKGLSLEHFDAGVDLLELAEFYEPAADLAGVRLTTHGSTMVFADRGLCRRALSNLMSNALRHSPPGTEIKLRTFSEGDQTCLEVEDQGPGIPAGSLEHIFEPFYRVPGQAAGDGIGLGLTIVRRIVELHGGSVIIKSSKGRGTCIGFKLSNT